MRKQFVWLWAFSSPQLAIRLGLWAGLGVLVPRKYLVRDAISTKHTYNHYGPRVVDGGVTATGVLSRERGNLITISSTL